MTTFTLSSFKKEVKDLVGNNYEVIEPSNKKIFRNNEKIKIKHIACGFEYTVSRDSFIVLGNRCARCFPKKDITIDTFINEIKLLTGDEFEIVDGSNYKTSRSKILMRHNKCGYEYLMDRHDFIHSGYRCPNCDRKIGYDTERLKKEVFKAVGNEYTVLGEYTKSNEKVLMRHNKCGYEYLVAPDHFLGKTQKSRCPKCAIQRTVERQTLTTEKFQDVLDTQFTKGTFILLEEYKGNHIPMKIKNSICGHEFVIQPNNLTRKGNDDTYCPVCSKPKTEQYISSILDSLNISYETQATFDDLKYKNNLRFDFKVYCNNDKFFLLEYNGIQHYQEVFGRKSFIDTLVRDQVKSDYCKDHKINLEIISELDSHLTTRKQVNALIDESLNKILKKYNLV